MMKRIMLAVAALLATLSIDRAACAGETSERDLGSERAGVSLRVAGSLGLSHGGRFTRKFGTMVLGAERGMTGPIGPGFLRGRLAAGIELVPIFVLSQRTTTYGVGFSLLARHYFETRGSIRPFLTFGAGMLVSEDEIPTGTANLNFTPQLGAGLRFESSSGRVFTMEYRIHHLSNGGRVEPNPGMNSSVLQFGLALTTRRD